MRIGETVRERFAPEFLLLQVLEHRCRLRNGDGRHFGVVKAVDAGPGKTDAKTLQQRRGILLLAHQVLIFHGAIAISIYSDIIWIKCWKFFCHLI